MKVMKHLAASFAAFVLFASASAFAQQPANSAQSHVQVVHSYKNDISAPLSLMQQPYVGKGEESEAAHEGPENPPVPRNHVDSPDPVVQNTAAPTPLIPSPILNFEGIDFPGVGCNCAPPDTDGEVGATQFVQMVNEGVQVFDKSSGNSVMGPVAITSLWTGFGGVCQNNGDGDPVVLYDQLANRWVISQFAGSGTPTDECVAVSTTSDATGTYNRYGFHLGTNFFDYPHLGVWPDAYYMSMNVFNSAGTVLSRSAAIRVRSHRDARGQSGDLHHHRQSRQHPQSAPAGRSRRFDVAAGRRTESVPRDTQHDVSGLWLPRGLHDTGQFDLQHARRSGNGRLYPGLHRRALVCAAAQLRRQRPRRSWPIA